MKIVLCNGGLGNQVFQYIFSRWLELATEEECYLDDSAFWRAGGTEHNGFEITKVFPDSKPRLLSSFFTKDVWAHMISKMDRISVCQQIKNAGEDIVMAAETDDYRFDGNVVTLPSNTYLPMLANCKGNVYFHGYWINRDWLKGDFYEILQKELTFVPLTEEHNLRYAQEIAACCSVSVHIRRGDFITYDWTSPPEKYKETVECIEKNVKNAHYFVFSDDLPWCRANKAALGLDFAEDKVTFVEGNLRELNYRDMQLMSLCKGNIVVGSSSFSYLAALLNTNKNHFTASISDRKV